MVTAIKGRDICPGCGADRDKLREMLDEPTGSDNWELARKIILNCLSCFMALGSER